MKRKNGITVSALVLYITLLSTFVIIATAVSKNIEMSIFEQKALSISMENYSRVVTSLNVSASNADSMIVTDNTITFYMGTMVIDKYTFDSSKRAIYKGDILVTSDIDTFNIALTEVGTHKKAEITINFSKYSKSISRNIIIYV
jgi:hypothetical protein